MPAPPSLRDARELTTKTSVADTEPKETVSLEWLMGGRQLNEAERPLQSRFRLVEVGGSFLVAVTVLLWAWAWGGGPDRTPMPPRTVALQFERLKLDPMSVAPLTLAGAWRMTAPDPRFGGLSALAIDRGQLLALSDSGVLVRFAPPGWRGAGKATLTDLVAGPGSPLLKENRDSESLARDPDGRGWWVGFENHDQLWLYDPAFQRPLHRILFGRGRWPKNLGLEAIIAMPGGRLRLLPELAEEVVDVGVGRAVSRPMRGTGSRISDAASLPGGVTLVLLRDRQPRGLVAALGVLVDRGSAGWRIERRVPLQFGMFANPEGLAVQRLGNGRTRLWLVTDDNLQPPLTTDLYAIDLPSGGWPRQR